MAPMRRIASRLRWLSASVQIATRHTPRRSNAWASSRRFASVLIGVRCAVGAEPRAADLDLVGFRAGRATSGCRGSGCSRPPRRCRARRWANGSTLARLVVGEQVVDVAGHRVGAVGHPGVGEGAAVDRRRGDELVDVRRASSGSSWTNRPVRVTRSSGWGTGATVVGCHDRAMNDPRDPYGLRSLDLDRLRSKGGAKWQAQPAPFAAWVADMDFDVAPAIIDALRGRARRQRVRLPELGWAVRQVAGGPAVPGRQADALRLGARSRPVPRPGRRDPGRAGHRSTTCRSPATAWCCTCPRTTRSSTRSTRWTAGSCR